MGSIDLDPASSSIANKTVGAKVYFTIDDDGLAKEWSGNVWLNPPYAQPLIKEFADHVVNEYLSEHIGQACVLVNNATETRWLQAMLLVCDAVCFPSGRVKFMDREGNATGAPLQGQAIVYFGENIAKFKEAFCGFGVVLAHV